MISKLDRVHLLIGAGALAALYAAGAYYRARQLPPGPWGLPLIGMLPWLDFDHLDVEQEKMRRKYGPVFSYRAGRRLMVVLASTEVLRESLADGALAGRIPPPTIPPLLRQYSITFTEGKAWTDIRRQAMRALRDSGFGKEQSAHAIHEEISSIMHFIEAQPAAVNAQMLFTSLTNSTIATLMFGRRYANEDKRYEKFIEDIQALFSDSFSSNLALLFPALAPILLRLSNSKKSVAAFASVQHFIEEEVGRRESELIDPHAELQCVCDSYIQEARRDAGTSDRNNLSSIIAVAMELLVAGTDTAARSLEWLITFMAVNQRIQDKVHDEIIHVIGDAKQPQFQDRQQMPYTQAVIDEAFRFSSVAFNGVPHRAVQPGTTCRGYTIPTDALVLPFILGAHRDESLWEKANEFYPEHFLDQQGQYQPSKQLIPFSVGKRNCAGESLARMEIFLTFTTLMQRYRVKLTAECELRKNEILLGRTSIDRVVADALFDFEHR